MTLILTEADAMRVFRTLTIPGVVLTPEEANRLCQAAVAAMEVP